MFSFFLCTYFSSKEQPLLLPPRAWTGIVVRNTFIDIDESDASGGLRARNALRGRASKTPRETAMEKTQNQEKSHRKPLENMSRN